MLAHQLQESEIRRFERIKRNVRKQQQMACFLCDGPHEFDRCPDMPKGITREEKRRLMLAGKDRSLTNKQRILDSVFARIEAENCADSSPQMPAQPSNW